MDMFNGFGIGIGMDVDDLDAMSSFLSLFDEIGTRTLAVGDRITVEHKQGTDRSFENGNEVMVVAGVMLPFIMLERPNTKIAILNRAVVDTERWDVLRNGQKVEFNAKDKPIPMLPCEFKVGDLIIPIDGKHCKETGDRSFLGSAFFIMSINRKRRTVTLMEYNYSQYGHAIVLSYDEYLFIKSTILYESFKYNGLTMSGFGELSPNAQRELARKIRKHYY